MNKIRLTALALAGTFAGGLSSIPFAYAISGNSFEQSNNQQLISQRRPTGNALKNVAVTGTLSNGESLSGVLSITSFRYNQGTRQLEASGTFDYGTQFVNGQEQRRIQQFSNVPVQLIQGTAGQKQTRSCDILLLDLGPIFLDLLGLQVDLSQIVLDINAVAGSGNLLGNLLCALVGLLDGGPLASILNIIDQINTLLGSL